MYSIIESLGLHMQVPACYNWSERTKKFEYNQLSRRMCYLLGDLVDGQMETGLIKVLELALPGSRIRSPRNGNDTDPAFPSPLYPAIRETPAPSQSGAELQIPKWVMEVLSIGVCAFTVPVLTR